MARRRMVDPSIWEDEDFGYLDHVEQIFFIGLFSNADDEGRIVADPFQLRGAIFRYKDYTSAYVLELRNRILMKMGSIVLYRVDGKEYIWLKKWFTYQTISHPTPSKLPVPTASNVVDPKTLQSDSRVIPERFESDSGDTTEVIENDSGETPMQYSLNKEKISEGSLSEPNEIEGKETGNQLEKGNGGTAPLTINNKSPVLQETIRALKTSPDRPVEINRLIKNLYPTARAPTVSRIDMVARKVGGYEKLATILAESVEFSRGDPLTYAERFGKT